MKLFYIVAFCVLEKLDDQVESKLRKTKEKEWMLKLRTVFPFGMNARIGDEYKREDVNASSHFPSLSRKHHHGVRKRKPFNKNNSIRSFTNLLNNKLQNDHFSTFPLFHFSAM